MAAVSSALAAAAASTASTAIAFAGVSKRFARQDGTTLEVLRDISLAVDKGAMVALLGPSGSGKSTLLNMAAGLIAPDAGTVTVFGAPVGPDVEWRRVGYMFQDDRLLPWRTAAANVALALEARPMPAAERSRRAVEGLALVGLKDFASTYPHELSGGMRSRVALARSVVTQPDLLLMDEPFSRLDAQTRTAMHTELLRIQALRRMSILFVTHDVEEAVILADTIVMFSPRPGRVHRQIEVALPQPRLGTPEASAMVLELRGMLAEFGTHEETTA